MTRISSFSLSIFVLATTCSSLLGAVRAPVATAIQANAIGVQITDSDSSVETPQTAPLATQAVSSQKVSAATAKFSISANYVSFGDVTMNTAVTQSIILTSTGTAPLIINSAALTGEGFSAWGATLPLTLKPGQTLKADIRFLPLHSGVSTGQLSFTSNSSTRGKEIISLSGTGVPTLSAFYCSNTSITGSGTDDCTVTLNAAAAGDGLKVSLSGNNAAVKLPAVVTVPANSSSVRFTASVSWVEAAQMVSLTAKSGSVSKSTYLKLNAAVPTLILKRTSVAFGNVAADTTETQSANLWSAGTAPITISGVTLIGTDFKVSESSFPITLNPGQTATLELQFNPTTTGTATGQLNITSNSSAGDKAVISLSGTGIASSSFANVGIGTTPGRAIPATFLGLSHEWGAAQTMMGDSTTGVDNIYRQLLQNLTAYGSGPINLRIGGDSTDATEEPTSTTAQPFAELAAALGTHFSLGVNLGTDNVNLAVDQAKAYISQMPAGSLDAIEIGNEPDMYYQNGLRPPSYTYEDYLADFNTWKKNINPLLPSGTRLMGSSWAYTKTLSNLDSYDSAEASTLTNFSQHFYVGNGQNNNPDDILLTPKASKSGAYDVTGAVATTHEHGIPFRMGEMNSLSNGGENGISDAFESALWAVDSMFEYANIGVDGVNWHMGNGGPYGAFYLNIRSSSGNTNTYELSSVRPLYYGLLFFQAATGKGAHLLPVTLDTHANLTAWATIDTSGTPRLAIINKDESSTGTVYVTLSGYSQAQVYRLTAPNYQSTSGVTFAGQTFDGSTDGVIQGSLAIESVDVSDGVFQFPMPITSAALVVFTK